MQSYSHLTSIQSDFKPSSISYFHSTRLSFGSLLFLLLLSSFPFNSSQQLVSTNSSSVQQNPVVSVISQSTVPVASNTSPTVSSSAASSSAPASTASTSNSNSTDSYPAPAAVASSVATNNSPSLSAPQPALTSLSSSQPAQAPSAYPAQPTTAAHPTNQSSASGAASPASSIVIITVTRTGADGQVYTSLASTATALPVASSSPNTNSSSSSSSSSSTTWAIIGGVVGGLAALAGLVFIVFRCTQRRFSDLDDEDVAIKWPELVARADDPSTLNPLAARPASGHGIGDEEDEIDNEKPRMMYAHDLAMEPSHSDQSYPAIYESYPSYPAHQTYQPHAEPGGYYDPYLGPSPAPSPYPPALSPSSGYEPAYDLHSQPSMAASSGLSEDPHQRRSDQPQYRVDWDGNEEIPLTVVTKPLQVSKSTTANQNVIHQDRPASDGTASADGLEGERR